MELEKREFEAIEGLKSYQIVNENNLIIGVVSGLSNKDNFNNAVLFENAPNVLNTLKKVIDKMRLNTQEEIDLYKEAKKVLEKATT